MTQTPLFTLLFWMLLLPALWGSGLRIGFQFREQNSLFAGILTLGFGLIFYAHFLILAGLLHLFKAPVIPAFFLLAFILGGKNSAHCFIWFKNVFIFLKGGHGIFAWLCRGALFAVLFFTAALCFFPEISNDAIAIQLYLAKIFAQNASLTPSYWDMASFRPLLMNLFYASGMLVHNVAIAKFFHWFCGFLLLLALVIKIDEETKNKRIALFFGLMFWLTPTLLNQITTTYIDAGVSLFIFLGYCLTVGKMKDLKPADFFCGGLFIGMAVAARYLALGAFFSILTILGVRLFVRAERARAFIAGVVFSAGALLTSGFWFIRAWIFTGNPVYPYLGALFGKEDHALFSSIYFHGMGLPRSIGTFLGLLFDITFRPQYFDYHHWVGPFYLLIFPFIVYAAVKFRGARQHLLFAFLFTTFWYFTGQNVRYLLPALPIYLMAGAMGVNGLHQIFGKQIVVQRIFKGIAICLILSLLSLSTYHFRYQFYPLFRIWSMDQYLAKMERTIPIAKWIDLHLPPSAKLLVLVESHFFYFNRTVIRNDFDIRAKYELLPTSEEMVQALKAEGISYLLDTAPIFPAIEKTSRPIDGVLSNTRLVKKETSLESQNILGERYVYVLYSLV